MDLYVNLRFDVTSNTKFVLQIVLVRLYRNPKPKCFREFNPCSAMSQLTCISAVCYDKIQKADQDQDASTSSISPGTLSSYP